VAFVVYAGPPWPPAAPINITARVVTPWGVEVSFTRARGWLGVLGGRPAAFLVEQRESGRPTWEHVEEVNKDGRVTAIALRDGTAYEFRVTATNAFGGSSACGPARVATPLVAPKDVERIHWFKNEFFIGWEDQSLSETGYRIERSDGHGPFLPVGVVGPNVTRFVLDPSAFRDLRAVYRVCTVQNDIHSAYCIEAGGDDQAPPTP